MNQPVHSPARRWLAAVLLAHLLAVVALAASPQVHHWVHPDCGDDDHDCGVVLFLHGNGDAGPAPMVAPVFVPRQLTPTPLPDRAPARFIVSIFAASRVLEHAPPRAR